MSCRQENNYASATSFYYWKSNFNIGAAEVSALENNSCKKIYIRCFDIIHDQGPKPVAQINKIEQGSEEIVPVIFITNEVFQKADRNTVDVLFGKVLLIVDDISKTNKVPIKEMQFDCDWTESTRENYFYFLERFKEIKLPISATIRLHQVKYKKRTGVPPVKKGVLMYYNMGTIAADTLNSIYESRIADRYTSYLKDYPLELDLALPIFSWAIQMRDNKVIALLNKTNEGNFIGDTNFIPVANFIFRAKKSLFKNEYYYKEGDEIKIEFVTEEQLLEMAAHLKEKFKQQPKEIIYYDLDSSNLKRYDENIFKKISDRFN